MLNLPTDSLAVALLGVPWNVHSSFLIGWSATSVMANHA